METEEILVAFSAGGSGALGNIWRITVKKTDFYLDPLGQEDAFHLSVHGPSDRHPDGHRFHVKVDRKAAATVEAQGHFTIFDIPRRGHAFDGQELAPGAFRVARIRWLWDLQRPRFRHAAAFTGPLPNIWFSSGFCGWVEWLGSAKRLAVATFLGSCRARVWCPWRSAFGALVWLVPRRCLHPAPLPVKGTQ